MASVFDTLRIARNNLRYDGDIVSTLLYDFEGRSKAHDACEYRSMIMVDVIDQ
jgi:hypothetical protein